MRAARHPTPARAPPARPPPANAAPPPLATPLLDSFEAVTYSLGAAGFLGVALLQALAAVFASTVRGDADAALGNSLGGAVCAVAGLHYQWMRAGAPNVATRYSDWYLTTALMLVEFFVLAGTLVDRWPWLVGACAACEAMLLAGHVATLSAGASRRAAFLAGLAAGVALVACFVAGTATDDHPNGWSYGFAAAWVLYPTGFWAGRYRAVCYNALDLCSKGAFGIALAVLTFVRA